MKSSKAKASSKKAPVSRAKSAKAVAAQRSKPRAKPAKSSRPPAKAAVRKAVRAPSSKAKAAPAKAAKPQPKRAAKPIAAKALAKASAPATRKPVPAAKPGVAPVGAPAAASAASPPRPFPEPQQAPVMAREPALVFAAAPGSATPSAPVAAVPLRTVPPPRPSAPVPPRLVTAPPAVARPEPIEFTEGDHVVYPTHGVGKVMGIVNEEIAGHRLQLIVVTFDENRMTLRVPVAKARSSGLRKLASRKLLDTALATLKGRARIKRTMWSRRAQEYEAKINSGDPVAIAEVVRDLHRNAGQPDQSFSERQIYEAALDRLASELAAIEKIDKPAASEKLAGWLKAA